MSDIPGIYHKAVKTAPIPWHGQPIEVVSLGCGSSLSGPAQQAVANAELVLGSTRQLAEVAHIESRADQQAFPSPFSELANILADNQDKSIVVLASGDALFYGVGSWLDRVIGRQHLVFHPNISSVQACFHAIGQPWQGAEVASVHGRALESLGRHLRNHALLALLTDAKSNPAAVGRKLVDLGLEPSTVWVCEAMGTEEQAVTQFTAEELAQDSREFNPLNVCIVRVQGEPRELPSFPGIPDHWFVTGSEPGYGMISKRETRLAILSLMQPTPEEIAWDLGAGCGSVSVEWARWNNHGRIYAVENDSARVDCIRENSRKFGTELNLDIIEGTAPACCADLPQPNAIFIGGSGDLDDMLNFGWETLPAGGKLVASAVTEKSQAALQRFLEGKPGREWISLDVEKNLPHSEQTRQLATVHLGKCVMPGGKP